MTDEILDEIRDCVANIECGRIKDLVKTALRQEISAYTIIMQGMAKGMEIVGQRYEAKEYFLTELLGAAGVMSDGMEEVSPHIRSEDVKHVGKAIIGTVRGDIHDIGKNIVKMLLTAAGFEVHDLGVDVDPEKFVEKIKEVKPNVLALSATLTTTMPEMKNVVDALKKGSVRSKVKIVVGGCPVTEDYGRKIGADLAARDAAQGVRVCKEWVGG